MIDKKSLILERIIREYLKTPEPIGSEQLKTKLHIKISSSTIRSYFKKLEDGGFLMQIHISSGRIPTNSALKSYWKSILIPLDKINISSVDNLKESAENENIFFIAKFIKENNLVETINVRDKYLLLVFTEGEIVVEHSNALERFLQGFLGFDLNDLKQICNQVGAFNLSKKIDGFLSEDELQRAGNRELAEMYHNQMVDEHFFLNSIDGSLIDRVEDGLNFISKEYMLIKQDALIEERKAKLISLGHLSRDFENFFNKAMKE